MDRRSIVLKLGSYDRGLFTVLRFQALFIFPDLIPQISNANGYNNLKITSPIATAIFVGIAMMVDEIIAFCAPLGGFL